VTIGFCQRNEDFVLYRNIPKIDFPVPYITFGGASISGEGGGYGFGSMSEKEASRVLKKAWESGFTLYDTAPIYGFGLSEERMGKYLPKEAKIISKSGVDWHDTKRVNMTNDPAVTEKMLNQSLKRLNREMIDIFMIHWPDAAVDIRLPLEVLVRAQQEGKIKHIGLCNTNLEDLTKASEICEINIIQSELNLFNQEPFLKLNNTWKDKLSMSWGTFDKGILSGRVTRDRKYSKEDCRSWAPWWNKKEVLEKIDRTKELQKILADYHISLADFCLHYNFHYGISTCLIGLKKEADIVHITSTLQQKLMRERIEEVLTSWKSHS
jgi:aryl-alcohol dehydrogenase-like predicted oxidoreductase